MQKILKGTLCAVAVSAALYGGSLISGMNSEISSDELLLANVEALSEGPGDDKSPDKYICGTAMVYSNNVTYFNGIPSGQCGMYYSCVAGSEPTCQSGFEGYSYSFNPYPGMKTVSTPETIHCK